MKTFFFISLSIIISFSGISQNVFRARIIDSENENPVPNASIVYGSMGLTSDSSGYFEISSSEYPLILEISHVSYHSQNAVIQSHLESGKIIRLIPITFTIDEVEITGRKLTRYFEKEYFYMTDYLLLDDYILTIGYEKSQLSKGQIKMINKNQGIIACQAISNPKKLFQDAFGQVYLFASDSVFHVFFDGEKFNLLFPQLAGNFSPDLMKLQIVQSHLYVFKEILAGERVHEYFRYNAYNREEKTMALIYDEDKYKSKDNTERFSITTPDALKNISYTIKFEGLAAFEAFAFETFITNKPMTSSIFPYKDGAALFDLTNNYIWILDSDLYPVSKIKTDFSKYLHYDKQVIADQLTGQFFWVYYNGSRALLGEIDVETGTITNLIETPKFPLIENIQIRNGDVWFLYQPRIGEKTRSLFRMR